MHLFQFAISHNSINISGPILFTNSQYFERVSEDSLFDLLVEIGVSHETGSLIHLEKPRLRVFVNQNVKSEHFKAHIECAVIRLICSIVVQKIRLNGNQRFYDQVCDLKFEQIYINSIFLKSFENSV